MNTLTFSTHNGIIRYRHRFPLYSKSAQIATIDATVVFCGEARCENFIPQESVGYCGMYYILSLLSGVLVAVMITVNGRLSEQYGLHWATVFIHLSGLVVIVAIMLANRKNPFAGRHPWFLYLGGAVGVFNIISASFAFTRISVSAIMALGLLGQSVSGLFIDHYGLVGMPQKQISRGNLAGLLIIVGGIAPMMTDFEVLAVFLAFASGIGVVLNRTFNGKLAQASSVVVSSFYNYFIGLLVSLPVLALAGGGQSTLLRFTFYTGWYIYLGGLIGLAVVMLTNFVVMKIAAFYLTLIVFIGQVFTGIVIDAMLSGVFSARLFVGGLLVSAGLAANLLLDRKRAQGSTPAEQ